MRSSHFSLLAVQAAKGLSLMELGVIMVLMSVALVPVVKMIGGPTSDKGNAVQMTGLKNKEAILANTMVNKVLAGDYSSFRCSGGNPVAFDPLKDLPTGTSVQTFGRCKAANGNNPLYYEWTVLNLTASNNGTALPSKNQYFQASFNVTDQNGVSLLTMPINFFNNTGAQDEQTENTGVMVALDRSISMSGARVYPHLAVFNNTAAPYLQYRYKPIPSGYNATWGFTFPASPPENPVLNKWDNKQLDLVYGKQIAGSPSGKDPDSDTPNNETYPFKGVLSSGDCSTNADSKWNPNSANVDKNLMYTFQPNIILNKGWRDYAVKPLCEQKNNFNDWSINVINEKLSRFEAARTAALQLMLKLEEKPSVANSIELGFFPWGSYAASEHEAPLEKINKNGFFEKNREKLLWVNRTDPTNRNNTTDPIYMEGGTQINYGLQYARKRLLEKKYDRRIVVLLTDGEPSPNAGSNSNAGFGGGGLRDYTKQNLGCGVADSKKRITLFTVGLIAADEKLMKDMAEATPSGQGFFAKDITSLTPIFETVAYQIQKLSLISTADRYGLKISQDDECP